MCQDKPQTDVDRRDGVLYEPLVVDMQCWGSGGCDCGCVFRYSRDGYIFNDMVLALLDSFSNSIPMLKCQLHKQTKKIANSNLLLSC